jgi:hypothetical protein
MKIPPITLISILVLSVAASAQTTSKSSLATHTNYGNYARQGNTTSFRTVPANTELTAGKQLAIGAGTSSGGVDTIVGWNRWKGNVVTVDVSEQGAVSVSSSQRPFVGGSTASANVTNIVPGPHSLMLTIGGRAGEIGMLQFFATGITDRGVGVKYAFDVGNNGKVDFAWSTSGYASKLMKVRIPSSNRLLVKITSRVVVSVPTGGRVRYKTGASLRFTPGPHCAALAYGESCGPRLSGVFSQGSTTVTKFALTYSNGSKNARGLLVFGTMFTRIPIHGSRCVLLTDPRIIVPFKTDAQGKTVWPFSFPTGTEADIKIQGADLGAGGPHLSNGLHVLCVK